MIYHRILNIALCAIRRTLLFTYSLSIYKLTSANRNLPLYHYQSTNPLRLGNHPSVLYVCFIDRFICVIF